MSKLRTRSEIRTQRSQLSRRHHAFVLQLVPLRLALRIAAGFRDLIVVVRKSNRHSAIGTHDLVFFRRQWSRSASDRHHVRPIENDTLTALWTLDRLLAHGNS